MKNGRNLVIAVGVPCTDVWVPEFGLSFAAFGCYFGMRRIPSCDSQRMHLLSSRGSMLSQLRENLVLSAIKKGCSHLLMLDSDMKFPRELFHEWFPLLREGTPIIAANCVTKAIPAEPTAVGFDGKRIYTDEKSSGLQEVESVGAAVMLIRVEIFTRIPRPWFYQEWQPEIQHFCGEDRYFVRKARAHGFKTFIEHSISRRVGHVGPFIYDHDIVGEVVKVPEENEDAKSKVA